MLDQKAMPTIESKPSAKRPTCDLFGGHALQGKTRKTRSGRTVQHCTRCGQDIAIKQK